MQEVTRESIKPEIDQFNDQQLKQIAEFIELLRGSMLMGIGRDPSTVALFFGFHLKSCRIS